MAVKVNTRGFVPRWGAAAAMAFGLLTSACEEPASYATRWRVEPRPTEPTEPTEPTMVDQSDVMTSPSICSRAGISVVETFLYDEFGCFAASETRPCFPTRFSNPDHLIQGLRIPPGMYDVVLRGYSASGVGWFGDDYVSPICTLTTTVKKNEDPPPEHCLDRSGDPHCPDGDTVCDCRSIEVKDEKTVVIDDFVLEAPPECENGIDDDGDGLVDDNDPGCVAEGAEGAPVANAGLLFNFSLLSGNDNAVCGAIGVSRFRISIDDVVVNEPTCRIGPFAISVGIGIGPHTISVVAINAAGEEITVEKAFDVVVSPTGALDLRELLVDFSDVDFLEPIVASAGFGLALERYDSGPSRPCGEASVGSLALPTTRVTIVDAGGAVVEPPVADPNGTVFDGSDFDCSPATIRTNPLTWGVYQVEAEALSPEGEVCFSNVGAPQPLSPGSIQIKIPRVVPPPDSCIECVAGSAGNDCNSVHTCVDGICVEND